MATMGAQCHCDVPDGFKPPKRGTLARGECAHPTAHAHAAVPARPPRSTAACLPVCLPHVHPAAVEQRELKRREQESVRKEMDKQVPLLTEAHAQLLRAHGPRWRTRWAHARAHTHTTHARMRAQVLR